MTTAQQDTTTAPQAAPPTGIAARFEVTTLPVADVDRAKAFYQRLGWRLDIDFKPSPGHARRAVHPARLAGLDPVRRRAPATIAGPAAGPVPRRRRHRHRPRRPGRPRRRGQRHLAHRARQGPRPRRRPAAPLVLQPRHLRRSRRQHVDRCRRSPSAFPAASRSTTRAPWPNCCSRPPSATASSRPSPRRTTGGTGTAPTWTPASRAASPRKPRRSPAGTWPRSSTSSSHPRDGLTGRDAAGPDARETGGRRRAGGEGSPPRSRRRNRTRGRPPEPRAFAEPLRRRRRRGRGPPGTRPRRGRPR